jgi:endonuclease IV
MSGYNSCLDVRMCGFFIELIMNSNSRRELKLWQQSMDALEHEMNTTVELGISHLVIQYVVPRGTARRTSLIQRSGGIGGSNDRESVRRRVASNLDDLLDRVPGLTLVLENLVGLLDCRWQVHTSEVDDGTQTCCRTQPAVVGSSIEELGAIRSLCRNRRRVKFCLDICHVHAMGSDLSTVPGVRRFQQRVIDVLGAENVVCMHISDCATPCGEKKHSHVAVGR